MLNLNNRPILGAGGYGIVYSSGDNRAIKLFYDLDCEKHIQKEAVLQEVSRALLLKSQVIVPKIHYYMNSVVKVDGEKYLCGLEMDQIPILEEFGEPLHILLGYHGDDINMSWGRSCGKPIGPENPSRGFFAGPTILQSLFDEDGVCLEEVAYRMGTALRILMEAGILPIDLEWIYGGKGEIYLIDFGLCEFGTADAIDFLTRSGTSGLASDMYVPHKGDRGYDEFLIGWFGLDA